MPAAKEKSARTSGGRKSDTVKLPKKEVMKKARALAKAGNSDGAIKLLRGLTKREPGYRPGWNLLADLQEKAGRKAQAKRTREQADIEEAVVWCDKAERARERNRDEDSRRCLERALELEPECPNALWWLADYWHERGKRAKALPLYKGFLKLEPDDAEAKHMIAALGGSKAPRHAPDDYVRNQFDSYAEDFDKSLVDELEYQGPELIMKALGKVRPKKAPPADIADLGCGTGLMGLRVKPFAKTLIGVDLSPKMIKESRKRRIYDRLEVKEITKFLRGQKRKFDVIVCADVIIYVGDIREMFKAVAESLRPGGIFAFTAEWQDKPGFTLTDSGRYAHKPVWLRKAGKAAGLKELHSFKGRLRYERGKPVKGYISVMGLADDAKTAKALKKKKKIS